MKEGYVKLRKNLINESWYSDHACVIVYIHLLCKANWKPSTYKGKTIHAGQTAISFGKLAEETALTKSSVRSACERLEAMKEIRIQPCENYTIFTLTHWAEEQATNTTKAKAKGNKPSYANNGLDF